MGLNRIKKHLEEETLVLKTDITKNFDSIHVRCDIRPENSYQIASKMQLRVSKITNVINSFRYEGLFSSSR